MSDAAKQAVDREVRRVTLEFLKGRDNTSSPITFSKQVGGLLFEGDFQFKRPDILSEDAIAVRTAVLTSQWDAQAGAHTAVPVDPFDKQYARAQATLEYVVLKSPDWWDLSLLREPEVLLGVYRLYTTWEDSFRAPVEAAPVGGAQAG
jgi:hypothetical protein